MQCLYCGKTLGLLKELTDGEFCSSQHRQRYRKLDKLALGRLLETEPIAAALRTSERIGLEGLRLAPPVPPVLLAGQPCTAGFKHDDGSVRPVFRTETAGEMPVLHLEGKVEALAPAGALAVGPPVPVCIPVVGAFEANPVAFRPPAIHNLPANLQLRTEDQLPAAPAGAVSHKLCLDPFLLPPRARGAAGVCARMDPAIQPLAFRAPAPSLPALQAAPVRLQLRAEDAVAEEVRGADVVADRSDVAINPSPGVSSVLPALASLFSYGRDSRAARLLPPVTEGLAPQNYLGVPVAYMELPMPSARPRAPRTSSLRIVETFEYIRPLDERRFDMPQSLVRLWQSAPIYLRYATVSVCLILLLWASVPSGGVTSLVEGRWSQIQEGIQNRAAVDLMEGFQDGMEGWRGTGDLSRSWRIEKAGYVRPGHLALYQPSMNMENYRMEFLMQIEKQAVGWVYRATDQENYYAAKITIVKPGPLPLLSLVRYPVIGGKQGPQVEIPIRVLLHNNMPYRVQVAVNGRDFSTSIEGQLVDFWHDDQLQTGGVGFFSDTGESARIYWMKISRQDDFIGRVCAYLYPNPIEGRSVRKPK